ncbi:site-specific DNA-methyltransferase [Lysinibacillus fusiformis]|uniref:DNA-methyltransferase n=1 Tax=Lysinibacillus fusiformis TaxID=28031 RepID=UPI002E9843B8|nr:site-specific DNA-methyltransferase [Lysinibacillus fusiformis]
MKNIATGGDELINQIFHGDCLQIMPTFPDKSIDMILCDLPYGTTQCKWDVVLPFDLLWAEYNRIIKDNGAIVLFGSEPFSSTLRLSNINNYKYDWIWDKVKGTGFLNARKQPMRNHETISVFYKKQCTYNPQKTTGHVLKKSYRSKEKQTEVYGEMRKDYVYESNERYPRSIQVFSTDTQNSSLHPTQKPEALCEYLIKTYTNEGEVVLDNCAGSGTTLVAARNLNRNFIGIELEEKYVEVARKRLSEAIQLQMCY